MRIAPFSHDLRPWFRRASARSLAEARALKLGGGKRSAIPWHDSLLLAGLLLVVVGWIVLRLLLALLATH